MTDRDREIVSDYCRFSPFIPHEPTEKQLDFLTCRDLEAMYGGAAGGGKSDALLMAALMFVHVPGYSALILRRTFPDLNQPGGIMDRAKEWLAGTPAQWNKTEKTFRFPTGCGEPDSKLRFGYLGRDEDKFQYAGGEYQYIGWDELTQFEQTPYRFLFSRVRRVGENGVPLRVRSASNPGGLGHEWVKMRFVDPGLEGTSFFPAGIDDNPHLDAEEYVKSLELLDPVTMAQLLSGDWSARAPGSLFRREWFEIVEDVPASLSMRPVRFWDLAATEDTGDNDPDYTVGVKLLQDDYHVFYVVDVIRVRRLAHDVERLIAQTAEIDGPNCRVRMQVDPAQAGKGQVEHYRRRVIPWADFDGEHLTGAKWVRAQPIAGQAGAGNVKLVKGEWIPKFLDELEAFTSDDKEYAHDDQVDALSGAYGVLMAEIRRRRGAPKKRETAIPEELLPGKRLERNRVASLTTARSRKPFTFG